MLSAIGMLWALLSVIIAGVCGYSFWQPFWFIHRDSMNSLGLFSFCIRDSRDKTNYIPLCGVYGGSFYFSNLPSQSWQASCALFGGGCALLCLCALLAILTQCFPSGCDKKLAIVTGSLQTLAVIMLITGLAVFPAGLDSRFVRRHCRGASMYNAGQCQIGWAYMLGIIGTALAIFSPILAQYTDITLHDRRETPRSCKPPDYEEVKPL